MVVSNSGSLVVRLIVFIVLFCGMVRAESKYLLMGGWEDQITSSAFTNDAQKVDAKIGNLFNDNGGVIIMSGYFVPTNMVRWYYAGEGANSNRILRVKCYRLEIGIPKHKKIIDIDKEKMDAWKAANLDNPGWLKTDFDSNPNRLLDSRKFKPVEE